jgi:hypothetical protein
MAPGGRITGRVVTDTGAPLPQDAQAAMQVSASALNFSTPFLGRGGTARLGPGGTFELLGLVDPRIIRVFGPSGWMLKAVMVSGRDYVDSAIEVQPGQTVTGMEIIVSNRVSSVSGGVTDERGQPALDTSVLIFPDDPAMWKQASRYLKSTRPDTEGRYRIDALPPSDNYLVIAVRDYEEGQVSDPAYLATIRGSATAFSLREGEAKLIDLRQK